MKLWDLIKIANRNLFRSRLRTFLTVMAIFVGSFTLTLTNGLGDGLRDYIEKQVKNIEGDQLLSVRKQIPMPEDGGGNFDAPVEYKPAEKDDAGNMIDPNSFRISVVQIETLAKDFPEVVSVTPSYYMQPEYVTLDGAKRYKAQLGMLSEGFEQKTEAGKTIDGENQIMLPLSLAKAFNENINNLIGKTATVAYKTGENGEMKTISLQIVGISTKGFMANFNSFVDAKTAKMIYEDQNRNSEDFNQFGIFTFRLNTSDEAKIEETKKKLEEKGFDAMSIADVKKRTYDAIGILQVGLNFFAFIALLAASFGIINTLVIAVLERTKEVGLQKALGMSRGKVFLLFSFESILIGFWGAVLGIVAAIVVGFIANTYLAQTYLASFEGYKLFVFTPLAIILVILLICFIAFLAGVMPAFRASRLNPIEALRYE